MLLNFLMFWLMAVEAIICLLLSLPFGKAASQNCIQFLSRQFGGKHSIANRIANVLFALVLILFLTNIHTCYTYYSSDEILSDGLRIRLLTAQRDLYITGFSLFLFLLLRLVYVSIDTNLRLERSLSAMKKQAEGASNGYSALLETHEQLEYKLKKVTTFLELQDSGENEVSEGPSARTESIFNKLLQENTKLETQLSLAEKSNEKLKRGMEALKKQTQGQNTAYLQMLEEKTALQDLKTLDAGKDAKIEEQRKELEALKSEAESLKTQVQDYDFMFSEARKKAD